MLSKPSPELAEDFLPRPTQMPLRPGRVSGRGERDLLRARPYDRAPHRSRERRPPIAVISHVIRMAIRCHIVNL